MLNTNEKMARVIVPVAFLMVVGYQPITEKVMGMLGMQWFFIITWLTIGCFTLVYGVIKPWYERQPTIDEIQRRLGRESVFYKEPPDDKPPPNPPDDDPPPPDAA